MGFEVTDLSCRRAGRPVLAALSLRLAPGGVLLLRGPNGAGKSTALRAMAGLLPAEGRVVLDGHPLAEDPDAVQERLVYAGHLDAVKPPLTVAENLAFWARLFGGDAERALDALNLRALADRPAHACSAGQKRRLGLARLALAPRRLWLLDEPTVSLDRASIDLLARLIAAHQATGGMAVIATHQDLGLADVRTMTIAPPGPGLPRGGLGDPFLADGIR